MEIVIHGTKDGSQTLFYTNYELSRVIVSDIRSGSNNDKPLGNSAYAVAYIPNGIVFSKYLIIKDTLRSYATGTIAVSLFLTFEEIMTGENIKAIIDKLLFTYEKNYIVNNLMNRGEAKLILEDWSFVKQITETANIKTDFDGYIEIKKQSTNLAAIIYFSSDKELQDYFDAPLQEQYSNYSQVLFVDKTLEGKEENPLLILKYDPLANLTGKIDLSIKKYKLYNFNGKGNNGCTIEISANGKIFYDKDNISNKDTISIKYCKNNCYKDILASGRINDERLKQYLKIDQQNKKVEVIKEVNFEPIQKTILFEIKKSNGEIIKDGEVKIGMDILLSVNDRYQKLFIGEQLKERTTIKAIKGGFIGEKEFVPLEIKENEILELVLNERKVIKIIVKDETGTELKDFDVWTNITKGFIRTSQLEFVDDEIRGTYNITIRKNDYTEETINNFEPSKSQKVIPITLNAKKVKNYKVSAGYNGRFKEGNILTSKQQDGSDIKHLIIANKGYQFVGFKNISGTLTAEYIKIKPPIKQPFFILGTLFMALILSIGAWYFLIKEEPPLRNIPNNTATKPDSNNTKVINDSSTKKEIQKQDDPEKLNEDQKKEEDEDNESPSTMPKPLEKKAKDTAGNKKEAKKEKQEKNIKTDFFSLVNSGIEEISKYQKLLINYKDVKGDIFNFLEKICKEPVMFKKFINIPITDRKNAKTIAELEKHLKG